jgi:hypothetical protein
LSRLGGDHRFAALRSISARAGSTSRVQWLLM